MVVPPRDRLVSFVVQQPCLAVVSVNGPRGGKKNANGKALQGRDVAF